MNHTLVALVEDKPGVLNRVASVFRRRAFNIESLSVGRTTEPGISRMTIVIDSDQASAERVIAYLYKLVNVLQVEDLGAVPAVARDSRWSRWRSPGTIARSCCASSTRPARTSSIPASRR